jgi:hypothetical protein
MKTLSSVITVLLFSALLLHAEDVTTFSKSIGKTLVTCDQNWKCKLSEGVTEAEARKWLSSQPATVKMAAEMALKLATKDVELSSIKLQLIQAQAQAAYCQALDEVARAQKALQEVTPKVADKPVGK